MTFKIIHDVKRVPVSALSGHMTEVKNDYGYWLNLSYASNKDRWRLVVWNPSGQCVFCGLYKSLKWINKYACCWCIEFCEA